MEMGGQPIAFCYESVVSCRVMSHSVADKGRWFSVREWGPYFVLTPNHLRMSSLPRETRKELEELQKKLVRARQIKERGGCAQRAKTAEEQLNLWASALFGEERAFYNFQPQWSLESIRAHSPEEAAAVIEEFAALVRKVANSFCWEGFDLDKVQWQKHAWKHISFETIEEMVGRIKRRDWIPPQVKIDLLGTFDNGRAVFRKAEQRDPESVARLAFLFPLEVDLQEAAEHLFRHKARPEPVPSIPRPQDLALEYVDEIFKDPESDPADKARQNLQRLVSKKAARGSVVRTGRLPAGFHRDEVSLLCMMCYALFIQLRQAWRFLHRVLVPEDQCLAVLKKHYPAIDQLQLKVKDLKKQCGIERAPIEPIKASFLMAGKLLDLSASKVQDLYYPR